MLGGFSLGSAELGGLPTTELTVYIPVQTKQPEGSIILLEGNNDKKMLDCDIEFTY